MSRERGPGPVNLAPGAHDRLPRVGGTQSVPKEVLSQPADSEDCQDRLCVWEQKVAADPESLH